MVDQDIQVEDGNYTRIHNRIIEELAKLRLSSRETAILFVILRKTYGWQQKEAHIPFKCFREMTGLSNDNICHTLKRLELRNLVVKTDNKHNLTYRFNKYFTTWKQLSKSATYAKRSKKLSKSTTGVVGIDNKVLSELTTGVVGIDNKESLQATTAKGLPAPKETLVKKSFKETIIKDINPPPPPPRGSFDVFWQAYPKKRSKGQAEKAFKKVNPSPELMEVILQSIERFKQSRDWQKDNGQFIPYPATWLNAHGWEDEVIVNPLDGYLSEYGQATLRNSQIWLEKKRREEEEAK